VEGVGTVIALSAFKPGEIFNVGAGQALPGGREVFLNPQQVDGRASGRGTKRLPATKGTDLFFSASVMCRCSAC
jgi:hypothetical protein